MLKILSITVCSIISLVYSQHSGAYSSPQYAKHMYPRTPYKHYVTNELTSKDLERASWNHQPSSPDDQSTKRSSLGVSYDDYEPQDRTSSFFETARNFLSGSGGQLMAQMAQEFIARSNGAATPTSQVLSLNLTNLVILVVLKALILTAGFFGAGTWKGHAYARSLPDDSNAELLSQEELQLLLGYLASSKNQDYGCLQLVSCRKPEQATMYASAADLLVKVTGMVMGNKTDYKSYTNAIEKIRAAAKIGGNEVDNVTCRRLFKCRDKSYKFTQK